MNKLSTCGLPRFQIELLDKELRFLVSGQNKWLWIFLYSDITSGIKYFQRSRFNYKVHTLIHKSHVLTS